MKSQEVQQQEQQKQQEQFYSIRVVDYSLPGFVSGTREYYGTKQSIMTLLEKLADAGKVFIEAAKEYFSGEGPGAISVLYEKPAPMINPIKVIGTAEYEKSNLNFKFYNIWDCSTDFKIEHIKANLVYIVDTDGQIKRCVQATLTNAQDISALSVNTLFGPHWMCWGLPGFIEFSWKENSGAVEAKALQDKIITNTLLYTDTIFKSKQAAQKDQRHPHKPYLREFFLGIFGDG